MKKITTGIILLLCFLMTISLTSCSNTDIATTGKEHISYQKEEQDEITSIVYFTSDISPEAMVEIYYALDKQLVGNNIAVKLSTGEPPNSNYLDPELIKDVVKEVDGTIVECNTAYGGSRAETAMHYEVAKEHGFTDIAEVKILDEDGSISLTVENGNRLKENLVGAAFNDYDAYLVLSHFKGHTQAGYGGALKNISIGLASSEGKSLIHSGGINGSGQNAFLEAMAEASDSVVKSKNRNYKLENV